MEKVTKPPSLMLLHHMYIGHSAHIVSDRVTDPTEQNEEKHLELRQSSQAIQMPLSEAFKEKLALYFLTVTLLFLGHKLEHTDTRLTAQKNYNSADPTGHNQGGKI